MDLKTLHYWATVVEQGGFSAAAERLSVSQSTVSKAVRCLEDELGVALLQKGQAGRKRMVQPTPIGQVVYERARNILQQADMLNEDVWDWRHNKSGTLRVGISLLGSRLLTKAFFEFHNRLPGIELVFLEDGAHAIEKALLAGELDAGVQLQPVSDVFDSIELCNYPLMVLMHRDRLRRLPESLSLKSLREESFILFTQSFALYDRILDACRSNGFVPNIVCRTSQWDFLRDMVAQQMGTALLPKYYTDDCDPSVFAAVPLAEPAIHWRLAMAWPKHKRQTPALKAWLNVLAKEFPAPVENTFRQPENSGF